MIKTVKALFAIIFLAIPLTCCAVREEPVSLAKTSGKPVVYASFYPMYDLALKAAGGLAEVRLFVPDGVEPHDWEPSPQDIVGLEHADLFFYSGGDFETWVPKVAAGIQNSGLTIVETSVGIPRSSGDPHVWLAPAIAKRQFTSMCDALKEKDPAHAADYDENLKRWQDEFDKLDSEYARLRGLKDNKIAVTHEAFGYLCEAYGLEQIAVSGYSPDSEPDPASMAKIVALAKEYQIKVVFHEGPQDLKTAQALANEIGVKTAVLSPLESGSGEDGDYFSIMRKNLEALKEALK